MTTVQKIALSDPGFSPVYSDGDIEDVILEIYSAGDSEKKVDEILRQDNIEWALRYHFSPDRENLLSWYPFDKNKTLLEIGAGCGALTGVFCDGVKQVTAVELSERRAKIITARHNKRENLTVYAGNLNDFSSQEKFDYVTLIGVLEYAGRFTNSKNPFVDFLKKIKKDFLKEGGTLIIAIENKFGLKYWSGAREDHTGRFFDSMEGYQEKTGVETFGKQELKEMFQLVGFSESEFYYPLPDYKLPTEIFSDEYLPSENHLIRPGIFPAEDYARVREILFDEKLVMQEIVKNKNFDFFSNSFLIFVKN
jgi:SAM-dependent methyltransferase